MKKPIFFIKRTDTNKLFYTKYFLTADRFSLDSTAIMSDAMAWTDDLFTATQYSTHESAKANIIVSTDFRNFDKKLLEVVEYEMSCIQKKKKSIMRNKVVLA